MTQESRLVIVIDARNAERNARNLGNELDSIERKGNFATKSMDGLSVATRQLAGYMAGLLTIGTAVAKMDTYTGLQNRLKLVTASQLELNQALKDTFSIAQATGQAWDSTAQVYQRFADNAKRLGITLQQTAVLTDTVAKAIAISGGSAASAEAALVQFGQALASGVLRGEEFNSIAEQAPGLLKAIATGLNVNIGQLRSMAAEGKLTADVVVKSLEKAKASVNTLFGKTDFTIGQSLQMLSNSITQFVGEAGKGSGVASALSNSIQVLASNLETVTNIAMIGGAYWAGTLIPVIYKSVVAGGAKAKQLVEQTVTQYGLIQAEKAAAAQEVLSLEAKLAATQATRVLLIEELKLELQRKKKQISDQGAINSELRMGLLRQQQAQINAELTATENALAAARTRATNAGVISIGVGRGLLGLLGGPAGLAGIAIAVGASMLLMQDNTSSATDAFDLQKQSVADLADAYSKLTSAKLVSEMDETAKKLEKAKDQIDDARSKLLGMVQGSQDYIDDRTIQQQKVMLDVLEQVKSGSIDAAKALQTLQASKAFDKNEIQQARNYFANLEEGEAVVAALTAKQQLANSALNKASGIYENLEGRSIDLTNEQIRLNKELDTSKTNFDFVAKALLQTAQNSGVSKDGIKELTIALDKYANGSLKATELLQLFQKYIPIKDSDIETYQKLASRVEFNKDALSRNKKELEGVNKQQADFVKNSPNAIKGINDITDARNKEAEATKAAQKALDSYRSSALSDIKEMSARLTLKKLGLSDNQIEQMMKVLKALNYDPKLTGTSEAKQMFAIAQQLAEMQTTEDKLTESRKESTKQLEKQQKILQVNAKVLALSSKYNISEKATAVGIPRGLIEGMIMQESRGDTYRKGKLLTSPVGAQGLGQFMPATAKQYGVDVRSEESSINGMIKYMSVLIEQFGGDIDKAVMAYNAGPKNVSSGKANNLKETKNYLSNVKSYTAGINGFATGDISSKAFDKLLEDDAKISQEQAKLRLKLENDIGNQIIKIRNDLAQKLEDVDKANFTPEKSAEIKAELQRRADNEISIAEQSLKTKFDAYRDFTKSEEQLLKESFAKRQFEANHDLEMTQDQRKEAVILLGQQLQQETALLKLAQEQRLFQARLSLLSETQAMQERYRLEREEILKTSGLSDTERQERLSISKESQDKQIRERTNSAIQNWSSVQSDMNGASEFYRQDQERLGSLSIAKEFANSSHAKNDFNEQASVEDLTAQLESGLLKQQEFEDQKTAIIQAAQEQRKLIAEEYANNIQQVEDSYQKARLNTQIMYGQQMMSSLTSSFGSMFGEQSKAYKIMFAADKAYAIAAAGIAIQQNIAAASKVGFPYNLPLIAGAIAQGASIIANIRAIKDQGFAEGGFTGYGAKYEPAGIVHKGEIVWSQEDIKRWGGVNVVDQMRQGNKP